MHDGHDPGIPPPWIEARIPAMSTVTAGPLTIRLDGDPGPFAIALVATETAPGIHEIRLELTATTDAAPPAMSLRWSLPCIDLIAQWRGDGGGLTGHFPPDWGGPSTRARACSQAPLVCLHGEDGTNRLTMAVDEAVHLSHLYAGVREEDGTMACRLEPFPGHRLPGARFAVVLRLDLRPVLWHRALAGVSRWWEGVHVPAPVPDAGREPMYSTWYSLHQAVDAAAVERQCAPARELGCTAVIVDDGWQTLDGARGYAFTGDWVPERIPEMAAMVRRIHALGMRVLLWYAVPFVGFESRAWARFADRCLFTDQRKRCGLVDPRYPEVREFLIGTWERALAEWDLDGFKLDFVDAWQCFTPDHAAAKPGMDIPDLEEAVVTLLDTALARLRGRRPDILIEFRQSYTGPVMRRFGHLFRAGDCPADAIGNRQRILDIRMLCGATAAHADMLMWHRDEPAASAALQLLNVLFAVPQISVDLHAIPADHRRMLAFWLAWWRDHRDCLLDGTLAPEHPEARYTQATARTAGERITCLYQQVPARLGADEPPVLHLVNATRGDGVLVDAAAPWRGRLVVRDVLGEVRADGVIDLTPGIHRLAVPAAGLATLERRP